METKSINTKLIIVLLLALLITLQSTITFALTDNKIDGVLNKQINDSNLPMIAATIIKNDEIIYSKTLTKDEENRSINPHEPMFIGSLSKSLTALGVMQLVEQNRIQLDEPINKYIPYFKVKDPAITENITVRHLLVQKTGLSRTDSIPSSDYRLTIKERVQQLTAMEANSSPGKAFQYLNDHYNILGLLIEEVTGQSYAEYMKENIFVPLGMNHTTANVERLKKMQLVGHTNIFGFTKKINQPVIRYDMPSGYIVSTLADMTTYLNFLLTPDEKILSPELIAEMRKTQENSTYAMGWHVEQKDNLQVISHSGAVEGFSSHIEFIPETNSGYVYLINKNHLIYNFVKTFDTLDENLHQLMTDQNNFDSFPSIWVIRFISLVILLLTFIDILNTKELMTTEQEKNKWIAEAVKAFGLILFLCIGLPFILKNILGLQLDLKVMLSYVPDFTVLLLIDILVQVIRLFTSVHQLIINE